MRKLAAVTLGVLGLAAAAVIFLLGTTAGLRWTVDQALSHTGAPVEIGGVGGRLLGPVRLSDVSYQDPTSGTRVRLEAIELDWRPGGLIGGQVHITHLHASGIEYTPGTSAGSEPREASLPGISIPMPVRVDELRLDGLAMADMSGAFTTLVQRASFRGSVDGDAASLTDIVVDAGRYSIDKGRIRLGLGAGMPLYASLDWQAALPEPRIVSGNLTVDGAIGETLTPVFEVAAPFAARGQGTVTNLLDTPRWTLQATIPEPAALDGVMASLPAVSVQGGIRAEGDAASARLTTELSLTHSDSRMMLTGEVNVTPEAVVVEHARLSRPEAADSVNVSGRIALSGALPFEVRGGWRSLQGPEDAPWMSRSGRFEAEGDMGEATASVSGTITPPGQDEESPISLDVAAHALDTQPEITGSAHVPHLAYADFAARDISIDLDFRSGDETAVDIIMNVSELQTAGRDATGIELHVNGTPAGHEASLSGELDGWEIETAVTGSYQENRWAGRLERLTAAAPADSGLGQWVMAQPTDLAWSPARSELQELCLESEETSVCARGFFAGGTDWQATASITGLPLQQLARETPEALRIDGALAANAEIGNRGDGMSGEASARIDRATVAWEAEDPVTTEYRDVVVSATLTPGELRATIDGKVDEAGAIRGELVTRDPLADDGALQGSISAELPSLRVIQAAVPALGLRQGTARLDLSVAGTRATPRVSGDGRIADAVLDVAPLGIQLSALSLDVSSDDGRRLNIETRADSGDGSLAADGYLEWPDDGGWQGEFQVKGDDAALVRTPKALIDGNPDLRITADETGGTVNGGIRIIRAELTPESGRPQITISQDIVIKGDDEGSEAARNPMAWHAKVGIDLGDDTRFRGYGMKARLSGAFEIDAPPRQPIRANGTVQIHDGEYSLYGRTFDVKRGRLVYTGGPVDNPGIDVEVAKEVRDVSVSMSVTGPLVDPELALTSTPAMSDTDKMSYLLLGRPASQASGAEAGLLLRAAASLVPGEGGHVPNYIQSTLGLDTLEVRTDDPETEGAAVELGKYLAPDLYVSYVAGFQQSVDIFRVRYELARHWLLQAESSTRGSGGDLLFTW